MDTPRDTPRDSPRIVSVSGQPAPDEAEVAAIMAAVEALWPKPVVAAAPERDKSLAWRFSGRWWQRDRFSRADRPWS